MTVHAVMPEALRYTAYDDFAWFYERYWSESFAADVQPILQDTLLPLVAPGGHILDLCCGVGHLSHWLMSCGFRVTGVDGSEEMIRLARRNAPRAEFVVADAREYTQDGAFDAAICTFDSLNHLPTESDLQQTLRNIQQSLRNDGLFLFDMNLEDGFLAGSPDSAAIVEDDHACVAESVFDPTTRIGCSDVTMFRREGRLWRRHDVKIREYCFSDKQVRGAFSAAGYPQVMRFDASADLGMTNGVGRMFYLVAKSREPRLRIQVS